MTLSEYEKRLSELTTEEFQKFNDDFGGGQKKIEQRVREFVDQPVHERRICQLLGLETEAEKLTAAALKSANAADQSAVGVRGTVYGTIAARSKVGGSPD
jgi:hypothetical protein